MADKERPSADDRGYTDEDFIKARRALLASGVLPKKSGKATLNARLHIGETVIPHPIRVEQGDED